MPNILTRLAQTIESRKDEGDKKSYAAKLFKRGPEKCAEKFGDGIYNLGSGNPISLKNMVDLIEKKIHKKIKRQYLESPQGDVFMTHADITKSKKDLKFLPSMNFEKGIENTVEWVKKISTFD